MMLLKTLLFGISAGVCFAQNRPPNVIFILSDDLGWGDLQCYGNPYVETPALNRLAAEGIRLTDYYSPSPLCAPARAAILTGRYNHRTGAVDVSSNRGIDRIALSELTMGDYFRHAGYATALIGKWHNGLYNDAYLPHRRGFDEFFGFPNGGQDYYQYNLMRNGRYEPNDGGYLSDVLNQAAIDFVARQHHRPFFLFLSHHAPHMPFQAPDSLVAKYAGRVGNKLSKNDAIVYAMIEAMDHGIGLLLRKLDELQLRENTIVIFTSDNGAQFLPNTPRRFQGSFSGEKGNVLEQGIRVPAIVSWKGTIKPGRVSTVPVHGCDWLPTLYALTERVEPENAKPLDGTNLWPLLNGQEMPELTDRPLFFQKNRYTPVGLSDASIRSGPWKLYWPMVAETMKKDLARDNPSYEKGLVDRHWEMPIDFELPAYDGFKNLPPQLFHLDEDPSERHDLAARYPEQVAALSDNYREWFDQMEQEWRAAWAEIKRQDQRYWENRRAPDPGKLFEKFWRWDAVKHEKNTDPLEIFKGYWSLKEK